jgi:cytochrome c553
MTRFAVLLAAAGFCFGTGLAHADPNRDAILADLMTQAKAADTAFASFSADRGKAFFLATQTSGKPDTASCTTCHTKDPKAKGQSKTPDRYTDAEKVAKWFVRNCASVLGRECSAAEKGDFITYMSSL